MISNQRRKTLTKQHLFQTKCNNSFQQTLVHIEYGDWDSATRNLIWFENTFWTHQLHQIQQLDWTRLGPVGSADSLGSGMFFTLLIRRDVLGDRYCHFAAAICLHYHASNPLCQSCIVLNLRMHVVAGAQVSVQKNKPKDAPIPYHPCMVAERSV